VFGVKENGDSVFPASVVGEFVELADSFGVVDSIGDAVLAVDGTKV